MDERNKTTIFLACIFLFVGIVVTIIGVIDVNNAEQDLSYNDNIYEHPQKLSRLNNSIRLSRITGVSGYAVIVLSITIIIIVYLDSIYKKVESIQLEINSLKYRKELVESQKTNNKIVNQTKK